MRPKLVPRARRGKEALRRCRRGYKSSKAEVMVMVVVVAVIVVSGGGAPSLVEGKGVHQRLPLAPVVLLALPEDLRRLLDHHDAGLDKLQELPVLGGASDGQAEDVGLPAE